MAGLREMEGHQLIPPLPSFPFSSPLPHHTETLQEVLAVLESQKNSQVLSSCIGVIEKMTKDPEMSELLSEVYSLKSTPPNYSLC